MLLNKFVRKEALPLKWCPGCGLHLLFSTVCQVLDELDLTNTVVVSGIGCTGRGAGYFNLDSIHGIHGRAIPLATGIKAIKPKLNVLVFSGDGDLLGIGGNHLLHAARRNEDITVICNSNEVLAMTGGQASPTARIGGITKTTPKGNMAQPINVQGVLTANNKYFYARTTPAFKNHLKKCLKKALTHQGFSFVEVINPCLTNYGKKMGWKTSGEIFNNLRKRYKVKNKAKTLKDNELGFITND
jgi:2-oxoglutarate ferredoxin oxidoreductase subunit beta